MTPAQERLVIDNLGLADRYIHTFCRRIPPWVDREAIEGAGREGLVKAAISYVPGRAAFSSYLYTRTMGAMLDECRKQDPNARSTRPEDRIRADSLDRPIHGGDREGRMLLGETIRTKDFAEPVCERLDLIAAIRKLPRRQRFVALSRAVGIPRRELAQQLGITESRVSQINTEARNELERAVAA